MIAMEMSRLNLRPQMPFGIEPHGILANIHASAEKPLITDPSLAAAIGLIVAIGIPLGVAALIWRQEDKSAKREKRSRRF